MTIKIFNDNPGQYIFPVLTMGQADTADIWLQAMFKVPQSEVNKKTYMRNKNFRIYLNSESGIAPNSYVTLQLPLYTRLVNNPDPTKLNQYADWWNGGTILLYANEEAVTPPALVDALKRQGQELVTKIGQGADRPKCDDCSPRPTPLNPLAFYSDISDLPKNDPSQLLEFTLGACVAMKVNDPSKDPPNTLDFKNVDFDVSYVNLAALPAAMGPLGNDQVGYVGTPQRIDAFRGALTAFLDDFPGWPRFVRAGVPILKVPSPLEIFARLGGQIAPVDLEPPPQWPTQLWAPIEALRTNWKTYAGTADPFAGGTCTTTAGRETFCDAIVDAKKLMKANYDNYQKIFASTCDGNPVTLNDNLMISHVYGWTPFTEAKGGSGRGCPAAANLLENTPGYKDDNYAEYNRVKTAFDRMNYGTLKEEKYQFNPWVVLIHGENYLDTPNAYAYSVDDAVGNIQAYGSGIIIDVGDTKNLENELPAIPPITINYALKGENGVQMTRYRICKNDKSAERPVNPNFTSFIISANNPENCPIYFFDNKVPAQLYTFKITQKPPFTLYEDQAKARWTTETAKPVACTGNTNQLPYQPSSATWCCDKSAGNGVFAFSAPEPHNAHNSLNHFVIAHAPETMMSTTNKSCSGGK